jgi:LuxR family transcriptional regulator, maltose regulon positive regulatory protein
MRKTNKPVARNDGLSGTLHGVPIIESIPIGSKPWFEWLTNNNGFAYEGIAGHFTARSELRRGIRYWYGHRRINGKLTKAYLGKSEELTLERMEQASAVLAGQIPGGVALDSPEDSNGDSHAVAYMPLNKFRSPALPQKLLSRPRLLQRIAAPVILISAPSGFGKTTLVNDWRRTCGMPLAWVTLNQDDNHSQHFWATLAASLKTIHPTFGQDLFSQLLSVSQPPRFDRIASVTDEIIRVIDEMNAPGICLVIEDFHHIQHSGILSALQTLLEQIPPKFHIIITSNTKYPLTLGNLRAKGTVVELKTDDLRFTQEEGVEFLKLYMSGKSLAYADMQAIVNRTEGWAAGLVLATSIIPQQDSHSKVTEIFTGAHIFLREFFMESVLHNQPEDIRDFLLRTSILEYLTGPLCNAVTGRNDSTEMLQHLWEESLFLERLEKPGWYRYHEMFAEMLRNQLKEQFPAEITRLHRKAANWHRLHGSPVEAIPHFLLSRSWENAAALIESVALNELERVGEDARLLRWIQQLPESVIQHHKKLFVLYIRLARLVLPRKEVEDFLKRTENSIAALPVSEIIGELQDTLIEARRFQKYWMADAPNLPGLHESRETDEVGQMLDGIVHSQRDSRLNLVKAEAKTIEVYQAALAKNHLFSILVAGGTWANLEFSQGHLKRSEQIAQQVLQQASELTNKLPEPASIALTVLSGVKFEWNQISEARQYLDRAVALDPSPIRVDASINMAILSAKIQSMQGDSEAALNTIEAARRLSPHYPSTIWDDQDLAAYQALFRLHQGDLTSADRLLSTGWEIDKYPFSAFVHSSMLMQQRRTVAAEEILRNLVDQYPHSFYWVPILRARVQLSLALFDQQKMNQARKVMAQAARIAAPEFFIRPFISSGPEIASLLSLVLHTEDLTPGTQSFIKGTLTMLGHAEGARNISSQDDQVTLAIAASISPRERDVLQAVGIGQSNQEIADKYSISASTVKTHLENIFRKLDVSNRTQAIAKAHALGLFDGPG